MTPSMPPDATPSADPAIPQQVRRPASTLQLLLVAVAVLAGAAVTFAYLSSHALPAAHASDVASVAAPASRAAAASSATGSRVPAAGMRWSRDNEYRWIGNHKHAIAYELSANEPVKTWTTHVRPALVVRCLNRKTDVFVYTETPTRLESGDGMHTVRLSFDDGRETDERWPDAAEHDALFAPDGPAFTQKLAAAHELRFGFTPHNADPALVTFDLGDAAPILAQVSKTCGPGGKSGSAK